MKCIGPKISVSPKQSNFLIRHKEIIVMSTKIETTVLTEDIKTQLNELCDEYYDCNQAYKVAETNKKMYTDAIKQVFKEQNISTYTTETGVKASVTTTNKPSYCEDQLIAFLKELDIPDVVKTKEYVDMEALENAIYHGQVDASKLAPFKEDHFISTLRITKPKRLVESN